MLHHADDITLSSRGSFGVRPKGNVGHIFSQGQSPSCARLACSLSLSAPLYVLPGRARGSGRLMSCPHHQSQGLGALPLSRLLQVSGACLLNVTELKVGQVMWVTPAVVVVIVAVVIIVVVEDDSSMGGRAASTLKSGLVYVNPVVF